MTRGTLYFIYESTGDIKMCRTCEFNGDMYYEGHGKDVIEFMHDIETNNVGEFKEKVKKFDLENFEYQNEKNDYFSFYTEIEENWFKVFGEGIARVVFIYGNAKYIARTPDGEPFEVDFFMSDHELFRNGTKDIPVIIIGKDNSVIELMPGDVVDLYYMQKAGSIFYKERI